MLEVVVWALLLLDQQSAPPAETPNPAPVEQTVQAKRTDLNLLGGTDSAAGESRRNENVQFNLIDNNALKYLNIRLGTNATIVTEFQPGTEILRNGVRRQSRRPDSSRLRKEYAALSTAAFRSHGPTASSPRDRSSRPAASSPPTRTITESRQGLASGAELT